MIVCRVSSCMKFLDKRISLDDTFHRRKNQKAISKKCGLIEIEIFACLSITIFRPDAIRTDVKLGVSYVISLGLCFSNSSNRFCGKAFAHDPLSIRALRLVDEKHLNLT